MNHGDVCLHLLVSQELSDIYLVSADEALVSALPVCATDAQYVTMVPTAQRVLLPDTPLRDALELGAQNLVTVILPPVSIPASDVKGISAPSRLVGAK